MWCHSWTLDIIAVLVSDTDTGGSLTYSDLEFSSLILHEVALLAAYPEANISAPRLVSDDTPTVSWSIWEAASIFWMLTTSFASARSIQDISP